MSEEYKVNEGDTVRINGHPNFYYRKTGVVKSIDNRRGKTRLLHVQLDFGEEQITVPIDEILVQIVQRSQK